MTAWVGPHDDEVNGAFELTRAVPPERWPYGAPSHHESCCRLFVSAQKGDFCDCKASDAGDVTHGEGGWPTAIEHPDDRARQPMTIADVEAALRVGAAERKLAERSLKRSPRR